MKNNQVTPENTSIPDNDDLKSELIVKIIDANNKPFHHLIFRSQETIRLRNLKKKK